MQEPNKIIFVTYSYRIKDATKGKKLCAAARATNLVWNFCNETSNLAWRRDRRWLTHVDLDALLTGSSKLLPLHSQSIQAISKEHATRRKQFKKCKLRWRSNKRSLGWIPFKKSGIKLDGDRVRYQGVWYRFFKSREFPKGAEVQAGSFSQDARGRWYVNFQLKWTLDKKCPEFQKREEKWAGDKEVGIDLGLKDLATRSDGVKHSRENLTKSYEAKLASAQRANKKKQVRNIHAKIKNKRKDWNHKESTKIIKDCRKVAIGGLNVRGLMKTKMAKSVADASWSAFKTMLGTKANAHNTVLMEVNEAYTSQDCSVCGQRTGPKGIQGLGVREWKCPCCGTVHDRDVNAARNIFARAFGQVQAKNKEPKCDSAGQYELFVLDEPEAGSFARCQDSSESGAPEKKVGASTDPPLGASSATLGNPPPQSTGR